MSTVVTMSQTVGTLTNGQTYRVRSRNAELMSAASQATKLTVRGPASNVAASKEGK